MSDADETDDFAELDRTETTDAVLRLLYQSGIAVSPEGLAVNLAELTEATHGLAAVEGALETLAERDLVRELTASAGFYRLTKRGHEFVEAEIDGRAFGYVD
ncbi:hypothetical protein JCM17823_20720 [Halorubrum gandharaense]